MRYETEETRIEKTRVRLWIRRVEEELKEKMRGEITEMKIRERRVIEETREEELL